VLQVLSNLLENALRSTPAGGEVVVRAAAGRLTVADTGPGLAAEELPRAFERFFLYSRYAQNRAVGTGLGLAIVKELAEAMGGTVTVESAPGRGTSFVVGLPAAEFLHSEHAAKASR
jgi:signal transduction histidine kinase